MNTKQDNMHYKLLLGTGQNWEFEISGKSQGIRESSGSTCKGFFSKYLRRVLFIVEMRVGVTNTKKNQ